jgi:mutator protein MutT
VKNSVRPFAIFAVAAVTAKARLAKTSVNTVNVVAAVIEENDAFLVTRRPQGVHLAGLWEFPGGKIAPAESHADALRRELREELDADVEVHDLVFHTTHVYPDRAVALFFYNCVLREAPRPLLGQEMRWVQRSELAALGFPPADAELISLLTSAAR